MTTLQDKVALITGASRGMGAEHVRQFLALGARVVFGDVLDADGEKLAAELEASHPGAARYVHLDVTSEEDWQRATALAKSAFGRLDVLVNNAGVLAMQSIEETSAAAFRRLMDINATGQFLGIKAVAPLMTEAGGGAIINISSSNGFVGVANQAAYTASKFAVRGLTKAVARELGPRGIRVNSVHPGGIATPMTFGAALEDPQAKAEVLKQTEAFAQMLPLRRWGEPSDVSAVVAFLASDAAAYVTGTEYVVDGGLLSGAGY